MNIAFQNFVSNRKKIAVSKGVTWKMSLNPQGLATTETQWNLKAMSMKGGGGTQVLRSFSYWKDAQNYMIKIGTLNPENFQIGAVSESWQDLIKSSAIEYIFVEKKSLSYISSVAQAWRFLATVSGKEPWDVNSDDLIRACEIADVGQPDFSRTIVLMALFRNMVDPRHLFNACPISTLTNRHVKAKQNRASFAIKKEELLVSLDERKSELKLPERRALWEFVRIVFTEQPISFLDAIRFAVGRLAIITGFRIGEVSWLLLDWRQVHHHVDSSGTPAGVNGGISESLLIRYLAIKQGGSVPREETQFVPEMFRAEVEETMAELERLTAPLRKKLRIQCETGRMLPHYRSDEQVDALKIYVELTGNPIWTKAPYPVDVSDCLKAYRSSFDSSHLRALMELQLKTSEVSPAVSRFYNQDAREKGLILRNFEGVPDDSRGVRGKFLRVSDVEAYLQLHVKKKQSDLAPIVTSSGRKIAPWEMLLLHSKCAVGEGRGDSVIDPELAYSIGVASAGLLGSTSESDGGATQALFTRYGKTDEDRALTLLPMSLRHLQNTELFRLGVADTIISKRFNRKSVAETHTYDHRSLAETLDAIELPNDWALVLGEGKAATVGKLIISGRAEGPIVQEFKHIQATEGEDAALKFLAVEADGFHITPYGACLNSFTVDPCPKHLECFNNCRHLTSTGLPEHRENLIELHGKLTLALNHAVSKPEGTVGKSNQISHAEIRLKGVEKLLNTTPGNAVFPYGTDLSLPTRRKDLFK